MKSQSTNRQSIKPQSIKIHKDNIKILGKGLCERFGALLVINEQNQTCLGLVDTHQDKDFLQDTLRGHFTEPLPVVEIEKKFFYQHARFFDFWERSLSLSADISALLECILQEAIRLKASDIHIESFESGAWLRYRLDGELEDVAQIAKPTFEALSTKIKLEAKLDITQIKQAQDGRYSASFAGLEYDFRISCLPLYEGESIALRILYKQKESIGLDGLALSPHHLAQIKQNIAKPHGIILITGPTGSGKSTTLYAILESLQGSQKKIITLEDPVESKIQYATQVQVMPDFGYAKALRAVLRQDPDIIMVGEIRDKETLELAFRAALTGHLVLATLHTNDAKSAFERLQNMGMEEHYILSSLLMVVSQRLLRRICPHCGGKGDSEVKSMAEENNRGDLGCEACNFQGVLGREVVSEVLVLDKETKRAIRADRLEEYLEQSGFESLKQNALQKAEEGKISPQEAQKI